MKRKKTAAPTPPAPPTQTSAVVDDDDSEHEGGGDVGRFDVEVTDDDDGGRLDSVLFSAMQQADSGLVASRSRVKSLIEGGAVTVDGVVVVRAGVPVRAGQRMAVVVPAATSSAKLIPQDLPLTLVYDDDDICVVDKAAGMVVHPGAGNDAGTIVNALLFRFPTLSVGGERRPGIVHRLDKDTSGLLVVAKNDESLVALQAQFQGRSVQKRYVACCLGAPADAGVTIDIVTGHARSGSDRRRFTTKLDPPTTPTPALREAHTTVVVRGVRGGVAVVDVTLHTGRTHQIRAHLADRGHPLLQDTLYGGGQIEKRLKEGPVRTAVLGLSRQALHAASLSIVHPRDGRTLSFTSPLPPDLGAVVEAVMQQDERDADGAWRPLR